MYIQHEHELPYYEGWGSGTSLEHCERNVCYLLHDCWYNTYDLCKLGLFFTFNICIQYIRILIFDFQEK